MSVQIERRWFSVAEYDRMIETGIFPEDDRIELIKGEVVKISPIGNAHAACVKRSTAIFYPLVARLVVISVQDPIQLDDYSKPQPDIALLKPRKDFYVQSPPTPADVLLIVEVADSSVEYDREVKVPLYARAGIPEVWLVKLRLDVIEIYAQPANGVYQSFREARRGDRLMLASLPKLKLRVDDILG
jgi:Uma2 family endonuclease